MKNDDVIIKSIKKKLEDNMGASAIDINIDCKAGHVTLYGITDNLSEKMYAEKLARSVEGVSFLENDITIATDGTVTDNDIKHGVIRNLKSSRLYEKIGDLGVDVSDGVVTLYGKVNNIEQEKDAINQAAKTIGVKDVVSKLDLNEGYILDDSSIVNRVVQKLYKYDLSLPDLVITSNKGTITLNGYVNDKYEMEMAAEIAGSVNGVKKVLNRLKIRQKS